MRNYLKTFYDKNPKLYRIVKEAADLLPSTIFNHYVGQFKLVIYDNHGCDDDDFCVELEYDYVSDYDEYRQCFELAIAYIDGYLAGKGISIYG